MRARRLASTLDHEPDRQVLLNLAKELDEKAASLEALGSREPAQAEVTHQQQQQQQQTQEAARSYPKSKP